MSVHKYSSQHMCEDGSDLHRRGTTTYQVVLNGSNGHRWLPPLALVDEIWVQLVGLGQRQCLAILFIVNLKTIDSKQILLLDKTRYSLIHSENLYSASSRLGHSFMPHGSKDLSSESIASFLTLCIHHVVLNRLQHHLGQHKSHPCGVHKKYIRTV